MIKTWGHLKTILKHKGIVLKYCFRIGLYRQGICHDLSKFFFTEFLPGCRYWQGTRSPNNAQREVLGYSPAWLHHKGRNKHHFEYWIDYNEFGQMVGIQMPRKYVAEMVIDRIAASKTYLKENYTDASPFEYYEGGANGMVIHKESKKQLEFLLHKLIKEGETKLLLFIKNEFLKEINLDKQDVLL